MLERLQKEEEAREAHEAAKAASRAKQSEPKGPKVAAPLLPNGVGIQGRGRAAMNTPLVNGSNSLKALQDCRQSLMASAEFGPMRAVVAVAPAGAAKFDAASSPLFRSPMSVAKMTLPTLKGATSQLVGNPKQA